MEIKLKMCSLRSLKLSDAASLADNANNINIFNNLRDIFPSPYLFSDAVFFISNYAHSEDNFVIGIDVEGKIAGTVSLHHQSDVYRLNAELGYWLGEPWWGKGIMTEAVSAVVDYAFSELPLARIYANVFETNKPSMRVLEKSGFALEAIHRKAIVKNKTIMDEYVFAKLK